MWKGKSKKQGDRAKTDSREVVDKIPGSDREGEKKRKDGERERKGEM